MADLINSLVAEDAQPSPELAKLEQEIDNIDPSELLVGPTARLLVRSERGRLAFRVSEVPTSGIGQGPPQGTGSFYGTPAPKLWPQGNQDYLLRIRGREAYLLLRQNGRIVFNGKYVGVQRGLDGTWRGHWRQGLLKE